VRRGWVDPSDGALPVSAQCALAGVSRSGWYYEPDGPSARDVDDMDAIDRIFTACPTYGSPRMTAQLARDGRPLNHKRVERLMAAMGIQAIAPSPGRASARRGTGSSRTC
jgi:putative transposase